MDLGKLISGIDAGDIKEVITLVSKNKDLLLNLPDLVRSLAGGLSDAGEQARAAGLALVGVDGKSGATTRLGSSAEALGSICDHLGSIAKFVGDAADDVDKVPMMGGPAQKLVGAAAQITDTTGALGGLADDLVALAGILGEVGTALAKLGDHLDISGTEARGFLGSA